MLKQQLEDLCRELKVASIYAFGSRAREVAEGLRGAEAPTSRPGSDLDIAVQPVPGALMHPSRRVDLMHRLEEIFAVPRVDLVILPEASPFLAADAVRGELLYCDDEDRQAEEELYYLRRAGDLAPLQQWRLQGILSGELRR